MLKYDIVHRGSKSAVFLDGDMDIDATEIMQEDIAPKLLDSTEIELDFRNVSFVDSTGIGLLISLVKDLRERGSKVAITRLKPDVMQVFCILQLPEILGYDVFEDSVKAQNA